MSPYGSDTYASHITVDMYKDFNHYFNPPEMESSPEYTEEQIQEHNYECLELTWDLYGELPENIDPKTREIFHIKTHYEQLFTEKGATIKYAKFKIH